MTLVTNQQHDLGESLYETYATPLEAKHWGQFIAIAPSGQFVLGDDLLQTSATAKKTLEGSFYLFKVGERAIGHIR